MSRAYSDEITVVARTGGGAPEAFAWRGRTYRIDAELASWQERRSWWRDDRAGGSTHLTVWRVQARSGVSPGVYELVCDDTTWRLRRTHD